MSIAGVDVGIGYPLDALGRQAHKLCLGNTQVMGLHDGLVDLLSQELEAHVLAEGRRPRREERPAAGLGRHHALRLELGEGLGDCVAVDAQLLGQGTYPRQDIARLQGTGRGGGLHLVDQLQVNRFAALERDVESHRLLS
jgi:hypothetical protein